MVRAVLIPFRAALRGRGQHLSRKLPGLHHLPIGIERIQAIGERVPLIGNLQPHGPFAMTSLHAIGGVPVVMKELLRAGLLHGDVMTVTGRTLAENLAAVKTLDQLGDQDIVQPVARPVASSIRTTIPLQPTRP